MSETENPWKRLSSKVVYENPWMTVIEDEVINPGGGKNIYGKVSFANKAIGIIPVDKDGNTVILIAAKHTLQYGCNEWGILKHLMVKSNIDLNLKNNRCETLLFLAVQAGKKFSQWDAAKTIALQPSVDFNIKDGKNTPLLLDIVSTCWSNAKEPWNFVEHLILQPNIDLLRRSVPGVVLTGTGHELELKGTITDGCDYDPNDDATKPRAFAADFTHGAWREDDPEPDLDGPEAGDYDINSNATQQRTDRGAAFSQLSGREEHEEDVVEDDKDYDPDLGAVKPRLKGVPQMDKQSGRDEEDEDLDYRDYESEARAAQPTPAGAVVFDRQSGNALCF